MISRINSSSMNWIIQPCGIPLHGWICAYIEFIHIFILFCKLNVRFILDEVRRIIESSGECEFPSIWFHHSYAVENSNLKTQTFMSYNSIARAHAQFCFNFHPNNIYKWDVASHIRIIVNPTFTLD